MKKINIAFAALAIVFVLTGCTSIKHVPYFQNAETADLSGTRYLHNSKIMPKDELTIYVNTTDPEASRPFNLRSGLGNSGGGGNLNYLVDNEGYINFPVLGKLYVVGMTKDECQNMIAAKLKNYLAETENPIVTVKMASFHFTVIGEVGGGGVYTNNYEKLNIIEGLAMAGDLTIYGHRENIMLIREDEHGERSVHRLNINDAEIMNSPYFYLKQNDIIYVEPQKVKARNTLVNANLGLWFTAVGVISSISTLVALVLKK